MSKNICIIGASGDIGIVIAEQLANDGHQLILHYNRNAEPIRNLKKRLYKDCILLEIQADLSKEEGVTHFLKQLVFPVDDLIFASGTAHHGLFQDVTTDDLNRMLSLHVEAPLLITKQLLQPMILRKKGNIIFITSIWGSVGASHEVVYSAVKGAQNSFVKSLAKEVGPSGISVNAVSPGFIDTKMNHHLLDAEREALISDIPLNRSGTPHDVAHIVQFLLDDKSSYIQGEIIQVTGGW